MKKRTWLWVVLGVFAALAIGIWLAFNLRIEERQRFRDDTIGNIGSARLGYYALSVFLQKHYPGIPHSEMRSLRRFAPFADTRNNVLFIGTIFWTEKPQDTETLLQWTRNGNHLVVPYSYFSRDFLQENFQIGVRSPALDSSTDIDENWREKQLQKAAPDIQAACRAAQTARRQRYPWFFDDNVLIQYAEKNCALNLARLTLPEQPLPQPVYLLGSDGLPETLDLSQFKTPLLARADNVAGTNTVRFAYGSGSITLVPENLFAHPAAPAGGSAHLNQFDNAWLAAWLAQDAAHILFFMPSGGGPGENWWWWKFARSQPLLTAVIVLLLAAATVYQLAGMGAHRSINAAETRQIRRYFSAAGTFLLAQNRGYDFLQAQQQKIWEQWRSQLPGITLQNNHTTINRLHLLTGARKSDIALWLKPVAPKPDKNQIIAYLRAHQRLRHARGGQTPPPQNPR